MFPERFKSLREKYNMSQAQVAELLDITEQAVNKYETHKGMPRIDTLRNIRKIFNVSYDYLLGADIEYINDYLNSIDGIKICSKIKELRLKRKYSQKEFSIITGITVHRLNEIENGILPNYIEVLNLSAFTGISLFEIIGRIETDKEYKTQQNEIMQFALDVDNYDLIILAMKIKKSGLKAEDVVLGKKII